jgi:hypothetical protein
MLNLPKNNKVTIYNSGCCGMAGSFDMKRSTTKSVCKWGGYFYSKIRSTDASVFIAAAELAVAIKF